LAGYAGACHRAAPCADPLAHAGYCLLAEQRQLLGPSAETLEWNKNSSSKLEGKNREDLMDRITHCPKCGKQLVPVVTISGRTDLQCISCDDPAVKWAESPLMAPEKPIVPERV
jgi:hypothetical protein